MHLLAVAPKSSRKMWADYVRNGGSSKGAAPLTSVLPRKGRPLSGVFLGVDPSLRGTGVSVICVEASKCALLHSDVFRFPRDWDANRCLGEISRRMDRLTTTYPIRHAALENAIYVQNYRTALILGAARGSAIAALALRGIPIYEYPPLRIKQALVGYGRASKEQIRKTLPQLIAGASESMSLDESDATAVALCHWYTHRENDTATATA